MRQDSIAASHPLLRCNRGAARELPAGNAARRKIRPGLSAQAIRCCGAIEARRASCRPARPPGVKCGRTASRQAIRCCGVIGAQRASCRPARPQGVKCGRTASRQAIRCCGAIEARRASCRPGTPPGGKSGRASARKPSAVAVQSIRHGQLVLTLPPHMHLAA